MDRGEENNKGRDGGEDQEHDQGDKGPSNRARSTLQSPVFLLCRGVRRRDRANSSHNSKTSRGKDMDGGKVDVPHASNVVVGST